MHEEDFIAFAARVDRRLRALTTKDRAKGVFLKAYLEAFRREGGDELYEQCRAVVPERYIVDFVEYPYATILRVGLVAGETLIPRMGGVKPYLRAMGRIAVEAYLGSSLGRTFLALVRPSPEAMLGALPRAISTMLSFGARKLEFGAGGARLECREDHSPAEANAGALDAVIRWTGATDVEVQVEEWSEADYDLVARWTWVATRRGKTPAQTGVQGQPTL